GCPVGDAHPATCHSERSEESPRAALGGGAAVLVPCAHSRSHRLVDAALLPIDLRPIALRAGILPCGQDDNIALTEY
ncbi:MAG: hypothetical protein ACR2OE_17830, partial [Thermomicrobiales bacterium]